MIILASQSPRRQQLMKQDITTDFKVVISDVNEDVDPTLSPLEAVQVIAKRKGDKIHQEYPHDVVISADTIVVIDNKIIGKPVDKEDAKRILKLLSNREHEVITAYCIYKNDLFIEDYVSSFVQFNDLSEELIDSYIASGSPMDKAGAYGMQDNNDFKIVKSYKGSAKNIIGFPSEEIKEALKRGKLL